MSNYNSTLQSNNTDLQEVLQTLQTKAAGAKTLYRRSPRNIIDTVKNHCPAITI